MQKILIFIIASLILLSCNTKEPSKSYSFYLGTYTEGNSKGIYKGRLNTEGTLDSLQLVAVSDNPSFLSFAHDNKVLLAVNEINVNGAGTLYSYFINEGQLKLVDTIQTGGAHPCHLKVSTKGDVLIANYTGGNIGMARVSKDGRLSGLLDVVQHKGHGQTERQTKPHAHSVWLTKDEQNAIAIDLGLDRLFFYSIKDHQLVVKDSVIMEAGAGPRHLAFHPNQAILYVLNELNSTVTVLSKLNKESWKVIHSISALPKDFDGKSYCADIHISPDGRFLYASNRGHNSLVIYRISDLGEELTPIHYEPVRGDWPRNFALTPDGEFLIVANQHSNNLVAFKRNKQTGLLTFLNEMKADMPVCVLFE